MRPEWLGVIGLGAIGGSVARQATKAGVPHVVAYATSPEDSARALEVGAVTRVAADPEEVVSGSDLVVLAVPPVSTMDLLSGLAQTIRERAVVVTDVSSVKRPITDRARELGLESQFVGSHPLCGTHETGFAAARDDLFRDAVVYVTPAGDHDTVMQQVVRFWEDVLEAKPVVVRADVHDQLLAWTSHLPQAVSSALAVALAEGAPDDAVYGAGARDTTRLAASSVNMWRDVLTLNRSAVMESLDALERSIGSLKHALADDDAEAVAAWLERAAKFRRRLSE